MRRSPRVRPAPAISTRRPGARRRSGSRRRGATASSRPASPGGAKNWEVRLPAGPETSERVFWISTRFAPQAGEGGFIAAARDVTGAVGEKLRSDTADTVAEPADALTGFANREQFHFELEREIARADLFARPLSLIVLGLDNFKTLNDTHGLLAGDEYLRSMADTLRATLPGGETAGRVGGDEVAILLPGAAAAEAAPRAEAVVAVIRRMAPDWEGNALSLTASAGVAVFPDHAGGAADLFLAADLAMHQAKRRGGARVRLHDPSDRERDRTGRLREQSNRIRAALAESRFVPYFQPVAEVGSGRHRGRRDARPDARAGRAHRPPAASFSGRPSGSGSSRRSTAPSSRPRSTPSRRRGSA